MRPVFLAALLLAACRTSTSTSAPTAVVTDAGAPPAGTPSPSAPPMPAVVPPNTTSAEEFRRQARVLTCAREVRCGEIGASQQKACEAGEGQSRVVDEVIALAKRGHYTVDLSLTGACLGYLREMPCHADRFAGPPGCVDGPVDVTLRAAVPPGGRCSRWDACKGGYCDAQPGCSATCTAFTKTGDSCEKNPICEPGAYCWEGVCQPKVPLGAACKGHWQACADGLRCEGYRPAVGGARRPEPAVPGVCALPKGEGVSCVTDESRDLCRADLFCDWGDADPVCRARLPRGADCGALDACADGLTCVGLDLRGAHPRGRRFGVAAKGQCLPFADVGGACDPKGYVTGCPSDMRCDGATRTCQKAGNLGDPCQSSWVPPGAPSDRPHTRLACRNDLICGPSHTCVKAKSVGEACSPGAPGVEDDPCWMSQCDSASRRCVARCGK